VNCAELSDARSPSDFHAVLVLRPAKRSWIRSVMLWRRANDRVRADVAAISDLNVSVNDRAMADLATIADHGVPTDYRR
jgi:hypothetical protein